MHATLWRLLLFTSTSLAAGNRVYVHPFSLFAYDNFSCEIIQAQAHKPPEMVKPVPIDPLGSSEPEADAQLQVDGTRQATNQHLAVLSELQNSLGLRFYQALRQQKAANSLFSPGNAFATLTALYLGATNVTADSLQNLLGLSADAEKACVPAFDGHKVLHTLRRINSQLNESDGEFRTHMWTFVDTDTDLLKEFGRGTQHFSDASFVRSVDFSHPEEAEAQVNSFIQRMSAGKIDHLFDDLSPSTNLLFGSSVHFKGQWRTAFQPEATSTQNFWVNDKTSVPVPLMSRAGNFMYLDDKPTKTTVVKMPLKKKVYILLALPHHGTSLDHIENQISTKLLSRWNHQFTEGFVEVSLPKFSMNTTNDLKRILSNMKLSYLLDKGADFSRLSGKDNFKVDQVVNKVSFEVSEEGVERQAEPVDGRVPLKFTANRPFFFTVAEENSLAILLLGRITNPTL